MVSYHCIIVTAPTCGSAGILPAVLYYLWKDYNVSKNDIYDALAVAGIIGNIVKQNASISGAKCGCQAEMGVVCSMAAVALSSVFCPDINIVECAVPLPLPYRRKTSAKFLSTKSWK